MEMTVNDLKTAGKVAQHNHQQQGGTAQLTVNTLPDQAWQLIQSALSSAQEETAFLRTHILVLEDLLRSKNT